MRIVYLHQYFTTPAMSGGTRSYEFARRLVADGHEVHMITSDRTRGGKPYETVEAGIRVTWIPVAYSNHMSPADRIRAFFAFALKSARYAARSKADVIFATSTPLTIAIPGIYAKMRQGAPLVFEVRDLWPDTPIGLGVLRNPILKLAAKGLERVAYWRSDQVIALSEGMKAGVVAAGFPDKRVTVIPNASDIASFSIAPDEGERFRQIHSWLGNRPLLVYAGTLGYANDVSYMARLAAETMKMDPEIRFLTVGDGRMSAEVKALANELGVLGRNFFMLPAIKKEKLPVVLSAATMTSSWVRNVESMWANSANKFFDSMAASRPIVINHEGWQADIIREHESGLVLHPTDYATAAEALVNHLRDEDWLRQARRSAFALAENRFSRDLLYQQFQDVLQCAAIGR